MTPCRRHDLFILSFPGLGHTAPHPNHGGGARHRPCSGTPNENKQRHAQPHPPRGCADPPRRKPRWPRTSAARSIIANAHPASAAPACAARSRPKRCAAWLRTPRKPLWQSQRQFSLWLAGRTQEDAHNLLRNYYTSMLHDHIDSSAEATVKQCQPQAPSSRLAEQAKHYRAIIDTPPRASQPGGILPQASRSQPAQQPPQGHQHQSRAERQNPQHQAALKQLVEHCAVQLSNSLQQLSADAARHPGTSPL